MKNQFAQWPVMLAIAAGSFSAGAAPGDDFHEKIQPLLVKRCHSCHGPEKQKGDLNLAVFTNYQMIVDAPEIWKPVYERVHAFEMPPEKAPQLSFDEQRRLVEWLRRLPKPKNDCNELASDRTQNFYKGYVMSRRLNRAEYANTARDLFGLDLPLADLLPADAGGGEGFDTAGSTLFTSSIHIEKYLAAATRAVETVLPDKKRGLSPDVLRARQRLLTVEPGRKLPAREAARSILEPFARRAFRRPVTPDEVNRLLVMFDRAWERKDGYVPSLRLALKAVLISPHFLFLVEPEPDEGGVHPLGAVPLASKLSYFLWSSMPDEELLAAAENGSLLQTNVYRAQIQRMLADPKAGALGDRFALQWLDLQRLGSEVRPDPTKFPEFDSDLNDSMRREVTAYFNHIVRDDRPLLELIDSDYTLINPRLAKLYGIPWTSGTSEKQPVSGARFQQVKFSTPNRGGILGMAAVHAITSYPLRTSPVLRGRWILESLLGDRVPMPPPDVPALDEESSDAEHLSLRQQLDLHRTKAECASCHKKMDPLGFGLENFDVLGRWRDTDRGQPIDAEGKLPSGETYTGPAGLKQILMKRKDAVLRHLTRKMTGFAFGRELNKQDECVINDAMTALEANEYRASVLIDQIAMSFPFRHRFYPKQN